MIILGTIGVLLLVIILIISIPIVISLQAPATHFGIQWLFLTFRWYQEEETYCSEFKIFSKKLSFRKKEKQKKEKQAGKKQKSAKKPKKTPRKKGGFGLAFEYAYQSSLIEDLFSLSTRFFSRLTRSINIKKLICWIGLEDYYWQGVLTGFLWGIPTTKTLQIAGNFEEKNSLDMEVRISLWKIIFAIVALLFRVPYVRVYRLYRILK